MTDITTPCDPTWPPATAHRPTPEAEVSMAPTHVDDTALVPSSDDVPPCRLMTEAKRTETGAVTPDEPRPGSRILGTHLRHVGAGA